MPDKRDPVSESPQPPRRQTTDLERERIDASQDRGQRTERNSIEQEHSRGYDEGKGPGNDVDPDSADAEVSRDDMLDE